MKKIGLILLVMAFVSVGQAQKKARNVFVNTDFTVESMSSINTVGSDISPALVDGELYFAAVREEYFNKKGRERKNKAFYDTYSAPINEKGMTVVARTLQSGFGETYHEGPVTYCKATGELFTTLSNTINPDTVRRMVSIENIRLRLVIRKKIQNQWTTVEELPFNNDKYNLAHPAISVTGDTLIFSSDMDSVSYGKADLFMSVRSNGKWSRPTNLGNTINTGGNEMFPTFLPGGYLSFASDGHRGTYGGLDIWYTTFPNQGSIINAGDKINSLNDDFGLVIHPNLKVGYFSSDRPGKGSDDIYALQIRYLLRTFRGRVVDDQTNQPITSAAVYLLGADGKTMDITQSDERGNFQFQTDPSLELYTEAVKDAYEKERKEISGLDFIELRLKQHKPYLIVTVVDKESGETLGSSKIEILKGAFDPSTLKQSDGTMRLQMKLSTDYAFYASSEGYFPREMGYSSAGKTAGEYTLTIPLEKLVVGKQFVLENLYYDLDKYNIRPDAALVLNKLVKIMNENPELKIELGSHTDCRASFNYNIKLSQNRSKSAVAYLVSNGIKAGRLEAKGYGETQLVNSCADGVKCTEAEHQANRRTMVKILEN